MLLTWIKYNHPKNETNKTVQFLNQEYIIVLSWVLSWTIEFKILWYANSDNQQVWNDCKGTYC